MGVGGGLQYPWMLSIRHSLREKKRKEGPGGTWASCDLKKSTGGLSGSSRRQQPTTPKPGKKRGSPQSLSLKSREGEGGQVQSNTSSGGIAQKLSRLSGNTRSLKYERSHVHGEKKGVRRVGLANPKTRRDCFPPSLRTARGGDSRGRRGGPKKRSVIKG